MPELLASPRLGEHAREQLALERVETRRFRRLYEQHRLELRGLLEDVRRGGNFRPEHYRETRSRIELGVLALVSSLLEQGRQSTAAAIEIGVRHTVSEVAGFERDALRLPALHPGAPFPAEALRVDALRHVAHELLAERFESSVRTYGNGLLSELQRRLGLHLALRSSWSEMANDVAGRLERHGVQGSRWKAERIVRTELNHAYNAARQAGLEAAGETLPGVLRQWDATLDERTSDICRGLHGQVKGMHEPWLWQGRKIEHPPAHPSCRSRVIAWSQVWASQQKAAA